MPAKRMKGQASHLPGRRSMAKDVPVKGRYVCVGQRQTDRYMNGYWCKFSGETENQQQRKCFVWNETETRIDSAAAFTQLEV